MHKVRMSGARRKRLGTVAKVGHAIVEQHFQKQALLLFARIKAKKRIKDKKRIKATVGGP